MRTRQHACSCCVFSARSRYAAPQPTHATALQEGRARGGLATWSDNALGESKHILQPGHGLAMLHHLSWPSRISTCAKSKPQPLHALTPHVPLEAWAWSKGTESNRLEQAGQQVSSRDVGSGGVGMPEHLPSNLALTVCNTALADNGVFGATARGDGASPCKFNAERAEFEGFDTPAIAG